MLHHPELMFWKKCPTCGYTEYKPEAHAKYPKAHKLTTYAMASGQVAALPVENNLEEQLDSPIVSPKE